MMHDPVYIVKEVDPPPGDFGLRRYTNDAKDPTFSLETLTSPLILSKDYLPSS
jgi:hypothetical protein